MYDTDTTETKNMGFFIHKDKIKKITCSYFLIIFLFLIPAHFQINNGFEPLWLVKKNSEGKITENNSIVFSIKNIEPLLIQAKFIANKKEILNKELYLYINDNKVKKIVVDKSGPYKIKFPINQSFLLKGENHIKLGLKGSSQHVSLEGIVLKNYFGISKNFPVGYIVSDDLDNPSLLNDNFIGNVVSVSKLFIKLSLSILLCLSIVNLFFYKSFWECFSNFYKFFSLPIIFFWSALFYSAFSQFKIIYPQETLIFLTFLVPLIAKIILSIWHVVKKRTFVSIFFLLVTFLLSITHYQGSGDTAPNELLPISIIYEQNLDFNEFINNPKYDFSNSIPAGKSLPYFFSDINGRVLSNYPIAPGILNTPAFLFAHHFGLDLQSNRFFLSHITSILITLISLIVMFLCFKRVCSTEKAALFFTFIYGFATTTWSISSSAIWQHGPSEMFIAISLLLILTKNNKWLPYSGFFLGMAVFNRPTNFLIALPLAFYVFFHYRTVFLKFALFAGIPAFFLSAYSYTYWGSISALGQVHSSLGFNGIFFEGLIGLLFSPSRGLLIYSPIFIFSFIHIFSNTFSKDEPLNKYLSVSIIIFILLYSKWGMWWGGKSFAYRLLTDIIPLLTILLAFYWEKVISKSRYIGLIFIFFLIFSVYVNFLGAFISPCGFNTFPNDIDVYVERLWDVKDSQIVLCTKKLFGNSPY